MNRRDFVRRGSLWVAAAAIIDPDMIGWTRRLWPGMALYASGTGMMIRVPKGESDSYLPVIARMDRVPMDVIEAYRRVGYHWHTKPTIEQTTTKLTGRMVHEYQRHGQLAGQAHWHIGASDSYPIINTYTYDEPIIHQVG